MNYQITYIFNSFIHLSFPLILSGTSFSLILNFLDLSKISIFFSHLFFHFTFFFFVFFYSSFHFSISIFITTFNFIVHIVLLSILKGERFFVVVHLVLFSNYSWFSLLSFNFEILFYSQYRIFIKNLTFILIFYNYEERIWKVQAGENIVVKVMPCICSNSSTI